MSGRDWTPGDLFALSGGYWQSFTLHAAMKLGLFTQCGRDPLPRERIAELLHADPRGVGMLLRALAAMGLLSRSHEGYANTPFSEKFLSRGSEQYMGHILMHHHYLVNAWARLDQAVLTGNPTRGFNPETVEHELESFLMGMFNIASGLAPIISKEVDLSGRRSLLDLGGGPGTYAIHFCQSNPGLQATVFDLVSTRPFAEQTIQGFGLSERIRFVAGDYHKDPLPGTYDAVWMSQILHSDGPEDCQRLVDKAVSSLAPGGMILVHEFYLNDTMDGPLFPALFALNMLVNTEKGQAYSERQVRDMLARAGVREIRRLSFRSPTDSGILAGLR